MEMIEDSIDTSTVESAMERISENGSKICTFEEAGKELGFIQNDMRD